MLYDSKDSFGLGKYRVYYSAGDKAFGGSIPGESSGSAILYATSQDGLTWRVPRINNHNKPSSIARALTRPCPRLGRVKPHLRRVKFNGSFANNILIDGATAVGVYDDNWRERNASRRFKVGEGG